MRCRYWVRRSRGQRPALGIAVRSIETEEHRNFSTTCGQNSQRPGVRTEQPEARRADKTVSAPACGQNSQRHDVRTEQSATRRADRTVRSSRAPHPVGTQAKRGRAGWGNPLANVRTEQPEARRADRTVSDPACGQNSQRHDVRTEQSAEKFRCSSGSTVRQKPGGEAKRPAFCPLTSCTIDCADFVLKRSPCVRF